MTQISGALLQARFVMTTVTQEEIQLRNDIGGAISIMA
jgi:hypothetical protein